MHFNADTCETLQLMLLESIGCDQQQNNWILQTHAHIGCWLTGEHEQLDPHNHLIPHQACASWGDPSALRRCGVCPHCSPPAHVHRPCRHPHGSLMLMKPSPSCLLHNLLLSENNIIRKCVVHMSCMCTRKCGACVGTDKVCGAYYIHSHPLLFRTESLLVA